MTLTISRQETNGPVEGAFSAGFITATHINESSFGTTTKNHAHSSMLADFHKAHKHICTHTHPLTHTHTYTHPPTHTGQLIVYVCVKNIMWWWWWLIPHLWGFSENLWPFLPWLRFFFFLSFVWSGDKLVHTNSTLYAKISLQWLSKLRRLWPSVPWQVACELVSG